MARGTYTRLRGVPKEYRNEVAHITAESLGLEADGLTLRVNGAETTFGSEDAVARNISDRVDRAKFEALVKAHGSCKASVSMGRAGTRKCGKVAVGEIEDFGMTIQACADHVRGAKASASRAAAKNKEYQERKKREADWGKRIGAVAKRLGISAKQHYAFSFGGGLGRYTDFAEVSVDELEALADRIGV